MRVRPSELYFIHDELAAWCFDRAVVMFGEAVESDVRAATRDAKNRKQAEAAGLRMLRKWLNDTSTKGLYRDPMSRR